MMPNKKHNKHHSPKEVEALEQPANPQKGQPQSDGTGNHGLDEVDERFANRSGHSIPKGGVNNELGNPQPGYGTEAPQVQNGGKR